MKTISHLINVKIESITRNIKKLVDVSDVSLPERSPMRILQPNVSAAFTGNAVSLLLDDQTTGRSCDFHKYPNV